MKRAYLPFLFKTLMTVIMASLLTIIITPVTNKLSVSSPADKAVFVTDEELLLYKNLLSSFENILSPNENILVSDNNVPAEESEPAETTAVSEYPEDYHDSAAILVNGISVPLTKQQLSELEEKIYACKTLEELDALLDTLQYYNKGVDMGRFEFYWETLDAYYTEEQIAMMRYGDIKNIPMPDFTGMKAEDAYQYAIDQGAIARLYYLHSDDSDLPVGYVYDQQFSVGYVFNSNASFFLYLQAPREITGGGFKWFPGDTDSDILAIAQELSESGEFYINLPNCVGMQGQEAKNLLEEAGFSNVTLYYIDYSIGEVAPGYCFSQTPNPAYKEKSTTGIYLGLQKDEIVKVPNVVGMSIDEAYTAIRAVGLGVGMNYVDSPQPGAETGYCIGQQIPAGTMTEEILMYIDIQYAPIVTPTPTPTASPTPIPTATPTPEPTATPTAIPTPTTTPE